MSGYQLDSTQPQFSQALTQHIQQTIVDLISNWSMLPNEFKAGIPQYLEINPPLLPVSQIFGFAQFTAQPSTGTNAFSGTLVASGSTSGAGPTIDALPAGKYLFIAGYIGVGDSVNIAQSWAINGPSGNLFTVYGALTSGSSHAGLALVSFTDPSNPITSTYSAANGAGSSRSWSFANMTIAAIRYANA